MILGVDEITGEPFVLIKYGYRKRAVLMTGQKLIKIAA